MRSQNNEEEIINNYFGNGLVIGKFLDIGAFSATHLSNTSTLADLGWEGVLVEPSDGPFKGLQDYYRGNPRIKLVKNAIDTTPGKKTFYDSDGDAVSSLFPGNVEKYRKRPATLKEVDCITPEQLFMIYGYDFDMISLDVELNNLEIFKLIPFDKLTKLNLICVEHDLHQEEMKKIVEPFGFHEISRNAENILFVNEN